MPADRLPLRPPPRALHYVTSPHRLPLCGSRPRRSVHVTINPALATCPKCCAVLMAETPAVPEPR